jgi:hypothetical protein
MKIAAIETDACKLLVPLCAALVGAAEPELPDTRLEPVFPPTEVGWEALPEDEPDRELPAAGVADTLMRSVYNKDDAVGRQFEEGGREGSYGTVWMGPSDSGGWAYDVVVPSGSV